MTGTHAQRRGAVLLLLALAVAPATGGAGAAAAGHDSPTLAQETNGVRADVPAREPPGGTVLAFLPGGELTADWMTAVSDRSPVGPVVALAGYSRWDDSDPLEHDTRAELFEAISEAPGLNLARLADRTGEHRSTVRYHCRVLQEEGLVERRKLLGRKCLFPDGTSRPGADDAGDPGELAAVLRDGPQRDVLVAVADREPVTTADVAAALDVDESTAAHHLSRLEDGGLLERRREGRRVLTRLRPAVRSALDATGP